MNWFRQWRCGRIFGHFWDYTNETFAGGRLYKTCRRCGKLVVTRPAAAPPEGAKP